MTSAAKPSATISLSASRLSPSMMELEQVAGVDTAIFCLVAAILACSAACALPGQTRPKNSSWSWESAVGALAGSLWGEVMTEKRMSFGGGGNDGAGSSSHASAIIFASLREYRWNTPENDRQDHLSDVLLR